MEVLAQIYPDTTDLIAKSLCAQEEFGIDIWYSASGAALPCFYPVGEPWHDDIEVEIKHEVRNGRNYWERIIHTPEGDLHDKKFALIVKEGSGSGPEIIEPRRIFLYAGAGEE